jgi:AcrR family transcriptional regulator
MATLSTSTHPRKQPRQARSRATVEAVLAAGAQVLIEHGYEKATTARIAERAGVSVGSLYQYYPNKEALVAALIERHADEIVATMREALADPGHRTVADGLQAIVQAAFAAHRLDPKLHKILNEQVPRVGRLGKAMDTSRQITQLIEAFLFAHAEELRPGRDPAVAAVVVETVIEAMGHKVVLERRNAPPAAVAAREVLGLLSEYLVGGRG